MLLIAIFVISFYGVCVGVVRLRSPNGYSFLDSVVFMFIGRVGVQSGLMLWDVSERIQSVPLSTRLLMVYCTLHQLDTRASKNNSLVLYIVRVT